MTFKKFLSNFKIWKGRVCDRLYPYSYIIISMCCIHLRVPSLSVSLDMSLIQRDKEGE